VSLSNVVATSCQYEALKHVTFAVQTLGKCAKMFPVMIWGYFWLKKRYSMKEVALAVAITAGCFVFFISGTHTSRVAKAGSHASLYGVLLMMVYLAADGYTSTCQQQMFKGYKMSSPNQVLFTSLCSIALSSFSEWMQMGADLGMGGNGVGGCGLTVGQGAGLGIWGGGAVGGMRASCGTGCVSKGGCMYLSMSSGMCS
jgi:adenosine 3'-phospho 5'-phosphosulfate transporter B2